MVYRNVLACGVLLGSVTVTRGNDWVVEQFAGGYCFIQGSYDPLIRGTHYEFEEDFGRLTVIAAGDWTIIYREEEYGGALVDIPYVEGDVALGSGESFTLHIEGQDLTDDLVLNSVTGTGTKILEVELGGGVTSTGWIRAQQFTLQDSTIAGDVDGPTYQQAINVLSIGGDAGLSIGGALLHAVQVQEDVTGPVSVSGDMDGKLWIKGDCLAPICIGGNLDAELDIDGACSGDITVAGNVGGHLRIGTAGTDDFSGVLSAGSLVADGNKFFAIAGDVTDTACITVTGEFNHRMSAGDIAGDVDIQGSFTGGYIHAGGAVTAEIRIKGAFSGPDDAYDISCASLGSQGAVAIDWDGYNAADDWNSGARVLVGSTIYAYDDWWTKSGAVYRITCWKGDLNNDNLVNSFDIDPFVMVLTGYGAGSTYDSNYPGLRGSALYHADMNCDGYVNSFDIDPFVLRLGDPAAYYAQYACQDAECPRGYGMCEEGELAPGGDAEAIAELFRQHVAAERLSVVMEVAADLAAAYAGTPAGTLWAAVLAELE